jgi:hypothetical protein
MNSIQSNKLAMGRATSVVMGEKEPIWKDFKAMVTAVGNLDQIIADIDKAAGRQDAVVGAVQIKEAAFEVLSEAALLVTGSICAWANANDKPDIAAQADYGPTDLVKGRRQKFVVRCEAIAALAEKNLESLADHNITADTVKDLREKIDVFKEVLTKPRAQKSEAMAATMAMKHMFDDLDNLLTNQLDKLMLHYKTSEPEFWSAYIAARSVVDHPGGYGTANSVPTTPGTDTGTTPAPVPAPAVKPVTTAEPAMASK